MFMISCLQVFLYLSVQTNGAILNVTKAAVVEILTKKKKFFNLFRINLILEDSINVFVILSIGHKIQHILYIHNY